MRKDTLEIAMAISIAQEVADEGGSVGDVIRRLRVWREEVRRANRDADSLAK